MTNWPNQSWAPMMMSGPSPVGANGQVIADIAKGQLLNADSNAVLHLKRLSYFSKY